MRRFYYKILIFILIIFICYTIITGIFVYYLSEKYIDSPCFVMYKQENNCIEITDKSYYYNVYLLNQLKQQGVDINSIINSPDYYYNPGYYLLQRGVNINPPQIEIFLTYFKARAHGSGCLYRSSQNKFLEVDTFVTKIKIEKESGDFIKVNNRLIKKNEKLKIIKIFYPNPWLVAKLEFENLGLVSECDSPFESLKSQRIVIIGRYGTEFSSSKGFLILTILIGGLIFLNLYLKRDKGF